MSDLFFSECRRYRRVALIAFLAHLALLLYLSRHNVLLAAPLHIQILALLIYALAGLGFALHQFASYCRPGRWLWLLHRPLPRRAIFGALTMASATMIVLAIGLPLLIVVAGNDWFSARIVDLRHYVMAPYVALIVIVGWLTGAALLLAANRLAVLILALPGVMLLHESSALALLAASVACALLMGAVVYASFKPNRATPPDGSLATVLAAVPLVLGLYLLVPASALFGVQWGVSAMRDHAYQAPVPGTDAEVRNARSGDLLRDGLRGATDARAERWQRELPQVTPQRLMQLPVIFGVPQQLSNKDTPRGKVGDTQLLSFSHDTMRFVVTDMATGATVATLGPDGIGTATAFPAVPALVGKVLLPHTVMQFNNDNSSFMTLATLPADEQYVARPVEFGYTAMLLTDRRLIAYATSMKEAPYRERYSVALPLPLGDLTRIDVASLSDGALVSFSGGAARSAGVEGKQVVVFVGADGRASTVATRAIAPNDWPLLQQAGWWLSPVLDVVTALPARILPNNDLYAASLRTAGLPQRSAAIWTAALLSHLLAVAGAWLWRRGALRYPGRPVGAGWLPACLVFGLPCLGALMVMYPHRAASKARADATTQQVVAL